MQLIGTLRELLPVVEGQSANGSWKKQDIIVETHEQFPKKVCISLWGDKLSDVSLVAGQPYSIDINIESREYNGKWYTDIKAWRIADFIQSQQPTSTPGSSASTAKSDDFMTNLTDDEDDVLPF